MGIRIGVPRERKDNERRVGVTPAGVAQLSADHEVVVEQGTGLGSGFDNAVLGALPEGAVVVDIAIDQGGCTVASRPTSHSEPTFTHGTTTMYCVTNMPGAAPITATLALAAETLPHVRALAGGVDAALDANPHLAQGVNGRDGEVVLEAIKTKT